jgi:hypothetical protein
MIGQQRHAEAARSGGRWGRRYAKARFAPGR